MAWTAQKTDKGFSPKGEFFVNAIFTDGTSKFEESYRASILVADWPDKDIRSRLAQLNGPDLSSVELGDIKPAPVVTPPTPEQIALTAAQIGYQKALQAATVAQFASPALQQAYDTLLAAQAAAAGH